MSCLAAATVPIPVTVPAPVTISAPVMISAPVTISAAVIESSTPTVDVAPPAKVDVAPPVTKVVVALAAVSISPDPEAGLEKGEESSPVGAKEPEVQAEIEDGLAPPLPLLAYFPSYHHKKHLYHSTHPRHPSPSAPNPPPPTHTHARAPFLIKYPSLYSPVPAVQKWMIAFL